MFHKLTEEKVNHEIPLDSNHFAMGKWERRIKKI